MIIVSACLAGIPCRYNGGSCPNPEVMALLKEGKAIPVCPEQLGGLATPREPVELSGGKAKTRGGRDHTKQFKRGSEAVARLAKLVGAKEAILCEKSPSCGVEKIYDGTFSGTLCPGEGLCTKLLRQMGLKVRAVH
jgi:uncharacterized protein YbbK (DUF523 family)